MIRRPTKPSNYISQVLLRRLQEVNSVFRPSYIQGFCLYYLWAHRVWIRIERATTYQMSYKRVVTVERTWASCQNGTPFERSINPIL